MNDHAWTFTTNNAPCSPNEAAAGEDTRASCNSFACDGKGACLAKAREDVCDLGKGLACVEAGTVKEGSGGCAECSPAVKKDGWFVHASAPCNSDACHVGTCNAGSKIGRAHV